MPFQAIKTDFESRWRDIHYLNVAIHAELSAFEIRLQISYVCFLQQLENKLETRLFVEKITGDDIGPT